MLDHIIVETDGVKLPLNRSAVVSVMDAKTLSVNPYDPNVMILILSVKFDFFFLVLDLFCPFILFILPNSSAVFQWC